MNTVGGHSWGFLHGIMWIVVVALAAGAPLVLVFLFPAGIVSLAVKDLTTSRGRW